MSSDRRTFLKIAGATALAGSAVDLAMGQGPARTYIPHTSWDCGMKEGIPSPEGGVLLFEVPVSLDRVAKIGKTPYGNRRVAVGLESKVSSPKLSATVMTGALDLELTLSNGTVEIEDYLVFKTDDGKYIYSRSAGVGAGAKDVRVAMDFEAPNGSTVEWLNTGKYVARRVLDENAKTLTLRVYDVSNVALKSDAASTIRIAKPDGVAPQPWNYRQKDPAEKQGKELIIESVGLSPSQRVGPSKRGTRNIIPITGGEINGRIIGKILAGGADYQNLSAPPAIDARYLWQASDGEVIIVRNTTSAAGGLVPTFEARADGPYAYLNTGLFLSSNPGFANGGVKITMYESTK
ncbi:MAG TPA: DUF3237 family protein [Bryobacteraceae bacterium]|nr:DUF3237 family protein [Bryobacteraceae bacterium]